MCIRDSRYITPESFGFKRSGMVPACFNHWRDNDRTLANPATWALTSTGLGIMHVLDDSIEFEAAILAAVAALKMGFSFGWGANPSATRAAIAGDTRSILYVEKPLTHVQIDHISYCAETAWPQQEPAHWVGAELEEIGGMLDSINALNALR